MRIFASVLAILAVPFIVFSQNYSGVVYDNGGNILSGVKVEFLNNNSETVTNASGEWSATLSGSTETIVFGKQGYTYEQIVDQSPSTAISISLRNTVDSYATTREKQYKADGCSSVSIPNSKEWNTEFKHTELLGDLAPDRNYTRRDPSAVIKVADKYYVWYSYSPTVMTGKQAPWDLNDLYYATSTDGLTWTEQGAAIERGVGSIYDARSAFTTEIFVHNNTYYLVYQAAADQNGIYNRNTVCMAHASSPDGPWTKVTEPVLRPTYTSDIYFDNNAVHDPCIVHYNNKFYLYYKGECNCMGSAGCNTWCNPVCGLGKQVKWGVAVADSPTGPYVKSEYNPITNTGHEIMVWPYKTGVAILQHQDGPEAMSIQYSEDGLNFEMKGNVSDIPEAAGLFRSDKSDTNPHTGISWGLGHVLMWNYASGWMYITRFDTIAPEGLTVSANSFAQTGGTYDDGIVPFGFNRNSSGVSYVNTDDWATYSINIEETGIYKVKYYASTPSLNAEVSLYVDDNLSATDIVPDTDGWNNYTEITSLSTFTLTEGSHILKLVASGSDNWQWNMTKFTLIKISDINVGACNEISADNVVLHPNPANNEVNISGITGEYNIQIVSLDGKIVKDKKLAGTAYVNLSGIDQGIYNVLLQISDYVVVKRLVVSK